MFRNITVTFSFVLLSACGGGSGSAGGGDVMNDLSPEPVINVPPTGGNENADLEGGVYYSTGNNSAILNGMVVGEYSAVNESLRKSIPFTTEDFSNTFAIGSIYILNNGDDIVATFSNISNAPICQPVVEVLLTDDAGAKTGAVLQQIGSFARYQNGPDYVSLTSDCLVPGETIYAMGHIGVGADRANIASAAVQEISQLPGNLLNGEGFNRFTVPALERILPLSYEVVAGDNESQLIEVLFANQSNETLSKTLGGSNLFSFEVLLLDALGLPLDVFVGSRKIDDGMGIEDLPLIGPGEEFIGVVSADFKGSASSMRVILDTIILQ